MHTIVFLRSNTNLLYKTYNVLFANEQKIDSKERGTCQILLRTKTPNDVLEADITEEDSELNTKISGGVSDKNKFLELSGRMFH